MNNFFLYLLLIHFINDFIIQNDELVIKKREQNKTYHLYHASIQGIISLIFLLVNKVNLKDSISIFLILIISHFFIDFSKIYLDSNNFRLKEGIILKTKNLNLFLLDQVSHIGIIYRNT